MRGKTKLVLMFLALCLMLAIRPETASAADVSVSVQGIDILSAANHTVQCGNGTAVYDPDSKTLRLDNAVIGGSAGGSLQYGIEIYEAGVTIELIGENTVSAHFGIYSDQPFTIKGRTGGKLLVDIVQDPSIPGNPCRGIYAKKGGLTVKDTDIRLTTAALTNNSAYAVDSWGGDNQIINSTIRIAMQPLKSTNYACTGINIPVDDASLIITDNSSIIMESLDRGISSSGDLNISGSSLAIKDSASYAVITQNTTISNGSNLDISAQDGQALQAPGNKISISDSSVNLVSDGTNGLYCNDLEIIDSSKVSVKGYRPALYVDNNTIIKNSSVDTVTTNDVGIFCRGPVEIAESEVKAVSSLDKSGIRVLGDLTIRDSDITAFGNTDNDSIFAKGSLSITGGTTEIGNGGIASEKDIFIGGIISSNGVPSYDKITNDNGDISYLEADYSAVDAAIKKTEAINREDYSNFEIVDEAVKAIVRGKPFWEQDIVDGYAAAIEAALSSLTPVPPVSQVTYEILEGANQTLTKGEDNSVTIKSDGDFDKFVSVSIDNAELAKDHYTAAAGSTIITLKPEYINTLTEGTYTVKIHYTDGLAQTILTLQAEEATEPEQPPVTPPDETDQEPSDKPDEQPDEKPDEQPEPDERPSDKPDEQPTVKPDEQPTVKPGDGSTDSPDKAPSSKPQNTKPIAPKTGDSQPIVWLFALIFSCIIIRVSRRSEA